MADRRAGVGEQSRYPAGVEHEGAKALSLIKWHEEDGRVQLGLPSDLDLPMASPLVESLRHGLAVGQDLEILADGVERISTASIQALLAASRHAQDHGQGFAIVAPSEYLREACRDLGVANWLEEWSRA